VVRNQLLLAGIWAGPNDSLSTVEEASAATIYRKTSPVHYLSMRCRLPVAWLLAGVDRRVANQTLVELYILSYANVHWHGVEDGFSRLSAAQIIARAWW